MPPFKTAPELTSPFIIKNIYVGTEGKKMRRKRKKGIFWISPLRNCLHRSGLQATRAAEPTQLLRRESFSSCAPRVFVGNHLPLSWQVTPAMARYQFPILLPCFLPPSR